jgi:hypothetical protein
LLDAGCFDTYLPLFTGQIAAYQLAVFLIVRVELSLEVRLGGVQEIIEV